MPQQLSEKFNITDDFSPVAYQQWRELVDASLKEASFDKKLVTHTYEQIHVQPLYTRDDAVGSDALGMPGMPPFIRGATPLSSVLTGIDLRQEHAHPDTEITRQAIHDDLQGGATSLNLRWDAAARRGLDPDDEHASGLTATDGIMVFNVDDLVQMFTEVQLTGVPIGVDAGSAFLPVAGLMVGLWDRKHVPRNKIRAAFNADPLATLAREGQLPVAPEVALASMGDLAQWTVSHLPLSTAVGVDSSVYHDAGANAAQDIAFSMATAVTYLREMTSAGIDLDAAARQILFRMHLGTHHFLAIAKIRAARRLWSRIVQVCGGQEASGAMHMHIAASQRVFTQRDPYVNLLRNTVAAFAAAIGGAHVYTSVPFDASTGFPNAFSRRVARNTVLVLQEESHLHRVVDAAGGSWFLDQLTEQLADKAWAVFQDTEQQGGMLAALESGWAAEQIDAAFAPRAKDIARRKEGITGVSEFPDVSEKPAERDPPNAVELRETAVTRVMSSRKPLQQVTTEDAPTSQTERMIELAAQGATIGQMAANLGFDAQPPERLNPLPVRSFAAPFEELRDASDEWQAAVGKRPQVFLANLGPVSHHTARATYSKNFFEAGGFEVITNQGFPDAKAAAEAFVNSGALIAVICSSDKLYPDLVPEAARLLKEVGARIVILAGAPREHVDEWQEAGVDRFIFMGCDVLSTLRDLLEEIGVIDPNEEPQ